MKGQHPAASAECCPWKCCGFQTFRGAIGGMTSILSISLALILNFLLYSLGSVLSGVSVDLQVYVQVLQRYISQTFPTGDLTMSSTLSVSQRGQIIVMS